MYNYLITPTSTQGPGPADPGASVAYDGNWEINDSLKFTFCYDSATSSVKLSCLVKSLVVWIGMRDMGSDVMIFMWGVDRKWINLSFETNFYYLTVLAGKYLFDERAGVTAGDSIGNIGTANFPSDPANHPVWMMNVNLKHYFCCLFWIIGAWYWIYSKQPVYWIAHLCLFLWSPTVTSLIDNQLLD